MVGARQDRLRRADRRLLTVPRCRYALSVQTESPEHASGFPDGDASDHDYRVRLSSFQGPLDLLLYLIRRAEVDIHDIPIATITDQYCEFLHQVDHVDIDSASEFLVTAAMLIQLKARTLAPVKRRGSGEADDGEVPAPGAEMGDPRQELVQALISYQRHRRTAGSHHAEQNP